MLVASYRGCTDIIVSNRPSANRGKATVLVWLGI